MDRQKDNLMEMGGGGENLFHNDPFLSLDNDLDDVSDVIRSNLFGEQPSLFDASRTPSPQYYRDTNIFITSPSSPNNDLLFTKNQPVYSAASSVQNVGNSYDKEIGEIVSLLQDDHHQLLSSPGPSSAGSNPNLDHQNHQPAMMKPDYSMMMDTSAPQDSYDVKPQNVRNDRIQYGSPSSVGYNPMDYHHIPPGHALPPPHEPNNIFPYVNSQPANISHPNQYATQQQFEQVGRHQAPSGQYMYEMPRALSSSAIHGMLGEPMQQIVVDETSSPTLIRPQSDQNLSIYANNYPMSPQTLQQQPNGIHVEQSPAAHNTKQELIKMLLEMSPGDFDRLRSQKQAENQQRNPLVAPPAQPKSPTPVDPVRKRPSLQINTTSPKQPLLISVGSSPSLDSTGQTYSPELASPQSSSNGLYSEWRAEEDSDQEEESASTMFVQPPMPLVRKGPKTERRTAHNLIEKKYRCSINDRINHLKEMLAPEESKLSKSATLRKAIDHINSLRQQNIDLIRENELFKKSIKALGAEVPIIVSNKFHRHAPANCAVSMPMPLDDSSPESAQV